MDLLKEKFDIFIQGGQSNAEGCGKGEVETPFIPNDSICYLYDKRTLTLDAEGLKTSGCADEPFVIDIAKEREINGELIADFSLTFAEGYLKSSFKRDGAKVLIIRSALGGAGFQKGNWGMHDYLYLRMIAMIEYALSLNPENKIMGFLWHQGEHDAFEGNAPENYAKQLTKLISSVREKFGYMPFIAGEFVHEWKAKNLEICVPILNTIRKVVREVKNAAFVETSDLFSNNQKHGNGDDIHFCREALYELGRRYFYEYEKLLGKTSETEKRMIAMGDSITVGTYFPESNEYCISAPNYVTKLKRLFNAEILENRAISGSSYSSTSKVMSEFALSKVCKDITGGQIVLVAMGTNDYGTGVELGNPIDSEDVSFYGAVDYCLRTIKNNNPNAEILVVLPLPRLNESNPNEAGYTLSDYRKAIRYKAELLGLKVIDGSKLNIDPAKEDDKKNYSFDGVHFNEGGQDMIADLIYSEYLKLKRN